MKSDYRQAVSSVEQQLRVMNGAPLLLEAVKQLLPLAERELEALALATEGPQCCEAIRHEYQACLIATGVARAALLAVEPLPKKVEASNLRVMQMVTTGDYL